MNGLEKILREAPIGTVCSGYRVVEAEDVRACTGCSFDGSATHTNACTMCEACGSVKAPRPDGHCVIFQRVDDIESQLGDLAIERDARLRAASQRLQDSKSRQEYEGRLREFPGVVREIQDWFAAEEAKIRGVRK